MDEPNLFTMLSAYRPGSPASPFENYCTTGLAYFLRKGHRMLSALFAHAAGADGEMLAVTEVQPTLGDGSIADLVLTFEGGRRAVVEVQVEPGANTGTLPALEASASALSGPPSFILVSLDATAPAPWTALGWLQVVEALDDDPDPLAQEYTRFVLRDILGMGDVPLDEAITTNRLYALGGAAIRRRFGERARYVNSASRPIGGRYRYLGTTFSVDDAEMQFWIGVVNEALPLSEHYHLMMASKELPLLTPAEHPRATGDWKWGHWTGSGRVVRPVTMETYEHLLARLVSR